jgi:hypothetical protein
MMGRLVRKAPFYIRVRLNPLVFPLFSYYYIVQWKYIIVIIKINIMRLIKGKADTNWKRTLIL